MAIDSLTTTNSASTGDKQHARLAPECPLICGELATLPTHLALKALRYAHRPDIEPDDIRDVRCTLQTHPVTEQHHGFIVDTESNTGAWTRWANDAVPEVVLVLPDCPVTNPRQDRGCSEYEGHPRGHTWQVEDPRNPAEPAL